MNTVKTISLKPGPKPNGERSHLRLLNMKVPPEFYEDVDNWRKAQPGKIVSRSQAIRTLVYQGMNGSNHA